MESVNLKDEKQRIPAVEHYLTFLYILARPQTLFLYMIGFLYSDQSAFVKRVIMTNDLRRAVYHAVPWAGFYADVFKMDGFVNKRYRSQRVCGSTQNGEK